MKFREFDSLSNQSLYDVADSIEQFGLAYGLVDLCELGLIVVDSKNKVTFWNHWMEKSSGIKTKDALGRHLNDVFTNLNCFRLEQAIKDALKRGMSSVLSQKFNPHILPLYSSEQDKIQDKLMCQMVTVKPLKVDTQFCLIQIFDVTSAMSRDQMLREQASKSRSQARHTKAILSSIVDAVITTDQDGRIDYMNSVAEQLTGWSLDDAGGLLLDKVFYITNSKGEHNIDSVHRYLKSGETSDSQDKELILVREDSSQIAIEHSLSPIHNSDHQTKGLVVVFRDVTQARNLAKQVTWQASHDVLTKLFNRNAFDQKLTELVDDARSQNNVHALLYLDLDQFKIVNDTCGHVAGDELLKQISEILSTHVRGNDVLARLGGDEFGVLLNACPANIAISIGNKIRQSIQDYRFGWDEKSFSIGVSIGIVEITESSESVENILSEADAACYAAKDNGRNQVHLYQQDASEAAERHGEMAWFSRIQNALEEDRFLLYVQNIAPIAPDDNDGHFEILIRMIDENQNLIPPGAFIPAAERYGLMSSVDRWVVNKTFSTIQKHREQFVANRYQFAINLSGASLTNQDTLNYIVDLFVEYDIPKSMISFEITETAAISNLSAANHFIRTLRKSGCQFSLDDFGSGLSSFAYLKNLPVDFLKIDGSFVKDMHKDPIDKAMVESINQIGHVMELKTIAEFAENDDIIDILRDIGVDYIQGYGVSKPRLLVDQQGNLQPNFGRLA